MLLGVFAGVVGMGLSMVIRLELAMLGHCFYGYSVRKNAEIQFAGKKAAIYTPKNLFIVGAPALRGMADSGQLGFQDAATPIMEGLIDLHHDIMFFLVFIVIFVLYLLSVIIILFRATPVQTRSTSTVTHHT
jgi:hypothetical protein